MENGLLVVFYKSFNSPLSVLHNTNDRKQQLVFLPSCIIRDCCVESLRYLEGEGKKSVKTFLSPKISQGLLHPLSCQEEDNFYVLSLFQTLWIDSVGEEADLSFPRSINQSKFSTVVSTYPTNPLIEPLIGPTICAPKRETRARHQIRLF